MLGFDMPRWRFDLLHPVDLVEDLAIGHGYEDLGSDVPKAPMNALPRPDDHLRRRIRTSMQGMGFMQIQSLTLSNDEDQFERMRWKPFNAITRITNPITIEHTMMRHFLLPGLIRLLASNRHHDLPQSVYELGTVVRDHTNMDRLAFLTAERSGGFAAIRGRIQAFLRDIGALKTSPSRHFQTTRVLGSLVERLASLSMGSGLVALEKLTQQFLKHLNSSYH